MSSRTAPPALDVTLMVGNTAYRLVGVQAALAVLAAMHPEVCNQATPFFAVRFEVTPTGVELRDDRHHDFVRRDGSGAG